MYSDDFNWGSFGQNPADPADNTGKNPETIIHKAAGALNQTPFTDLTV